MSSTPLKPAPPQRQPTPIGLSDDEVQLEAANSLYAAAVDQAPVEAMTVHRVDRVSEHSREVLVSWASESFGTMTGTVVISGANNRLRGVLESTAQGWQATYERQLSADDIAVIADKVRRHLDTFNF